MDYIYIYNDNLLETHELIICDNLSETHVNGLYMIICYKHT